MTRPAFTAASLTWHAIRQEPSGLALRVVGYADAVAKVIPLSPNGGEALVGCPLCLQVERLVR
jgi:hypothetical protein